MSLQQWIKSSALLSENYRLVSDHVENMPNYSYQGKGTAIIYNKSWQPYVHKVFKIHGRFTAILLKRLNDQILIGNVYYPSSRNQKDEICNINNTIIELIKSLPSDAKIILFGDWNNVMNPNKDRITTYPIPCLPKIPVSTRTGNKLLKYLKGNQHQPLTDIWRFLNPD